MRQINIQPVKRYIFIDALRGIAILGVIIVHSHQRIQGLPGWLKAIAGNGAMGVQLFFMVSAFTLFLSIDSRKEDNHLIKFFIRRLFRIAPLFFCGILLYLLIDGFGPRVWAPEGITWFHVFLTFTFLNGFYPTTLTSVVPGGWSIAVEMNFYLLVPFLFNRIKRLKHAIWGFILTATLSIAIKFIMKSWLSNDSFPQHVITMFINLWFPSQLPFFFLGFAVFFIFKRYTNNDSIPKVLSILFYLATISFFVLSLLHPMIKIDRFLLFGILIFLFVIGALGEKKLITKKPLCYIGKISFSCYIIHFAVIELLLKIINHLFPPFYSIMPTCQFLLFFIATLVLTIFISSFTYRYIEIPGMKIGRMIIATLSNNPNIKSILQAYFSGKWI